MNLLPLEERRRRTAIVKAGKDEEFWTVLKQSLQVLAASKLMDVQLALRERKFEEAHSCQIEHDTIQRIIAEPEIIIRANESLIQSAGYEIREAIENVKEYSNAKRTGS